MYSVLKRMFLLLEGALLLGLSACSFNTEMTPPSKNEKMESQGCLLGYTSDGLYCLSIATGQIRPLFEKLVPTRNYHYLAPEVDRETSTIYYIDQEKAGLMAWQIDQPSPEFLCHVSAFLPHLILTDEWTLLSPDRTAIYFRDHEKSPGKLVKYTFSTGERQEILDDSHSVRRPRWFGDGQSFIEGNYITDIRAGVESMAFDAGVNPIFSKNFTRLVAIGLQLYLYEYPSMQLLKTIPGKKFKRTFVGFGGTPFFTDDDHLVFEWRSRWSDNWSIGTYLFDLRTERWKKLSKFTLYGVYYSPECPSWLEEN